MNADLELRERLERAAADVDVRTEQHLERIRPMARRRRRTHQALVVAVIVVLSLIVVGTVWQLRPQSADFVTPGIVAPQGRIAFVRSTDPLEPADGADLFVLDAGARTVAALDQGPGGTALAQWSPDGEKIAYIREATGGTAYAIVVARADGSAPVTILQHPKAEGTAGPDLISLSWAPDGTQIAFSGRTVGRGRTVTVVNADGTGERVLDGLWTGVSWSPDGERLLVVGYPNGNEETFDLYTMRTDGSDIRRLTNDGAGAHEASWSPDGTKIVFTKGSSTDDLNQDVFVMDADGSNRRRLTSWEGPDLFPVWSPDGEWIAFASDRDAPAATQAANRGGSTIFAAMSMYAMRPDGSDVRLLRDAGAVANYPVSWAP